ncbi:MAG: MBL fold metallo-hydrolase [Acidimicrobiia bacterium]
MPLGPSWRVGDTHIRSVIESEQRWKWSWLLPDVDARWAGGIPWLAPYLDGDRMRVRVQALVVETPDVRVLVDTGVGNHKPRSIPMFDHFETDFWTDLVGAGLDAVDVVVNTHLHVDHVGWNTMLADGRWVPTFPDARHLMVGTELEHARHLAGSSAYDDVLADSVDPVVEAGLSDLVAADHVVADGVRLVPTPGHTPGHVSVRVESRGEVAIISGDMVHHPVQLVDPGISSSGDDDPAEAVATREAALRRWSEEGALLIGSHFVDPVAGRLVAEGAGYRLEA